MAWEGSVGCNYARVPGGKDNSIHEVEEGAQVDVSSPVWELSHGCKCGRWGEGCSGQGPEVPQETGMGRTSQESYPR